MKKLVFLHLSDIHFGQEVNGEIRIHEDVRSETIRSCKFHARKYPKVDGILVTGDIAFSGQKKEYDIAGEWLDTLAASINCPVESVKVVPGNHDVDLGKIDFLCNMAHDTVRSGKPLGVDKFLDGIAQGNEEANPLLPKLSQYRSFAARYGCDFESQSKPFWEYFYKIDETNQIRLIGLTTVQVSNKQDKLGNMVLGSKQYVISREDGCEVIVMMHHPLSWLMDRGKASQYLERARLVLIGHEHDLKIQKIEGNGEEHVEVYAGALSPPDLSNDYPFRYNWIEIEAKKDTEKIFAEITILPYIWENGTTSFVQDRNRLGGHEKKMFLVNCPNLTVTPMDKHNDPNIKDTAQYVNETKPKVKKMDGSDSFKYEQLRYFFWKHLSWQQRLTILAQFNVIPETLQSPIPQTMERLALEKAKEKHKLKDLWDAIMEHVPFENRKSNPFNEGE